jgi:hypothetical protein
MTTPTNGAMATRWIDAGKPRLIPSAAPIRALYTSVCEDLETQCTNVHLELRRLERGNNGALYTSATAGTQLWFDTLTGTIGPVNADDEPEAAWLRAQLRDELVQWLRHRWSRQREQLDEAAWRRYDWRKFRFGELVSYTHVLPATWDTIFGHEGSFYRVEDFHCIKPGCSCKDVCLIFSELRDSETVDVGRVKVTLPKLKATEATTPLASALWARLRATTELVGELDERRQRMRDIGQAVHREGIVPLEHTPKQELVPEPMPMSTTGPAVDAQPAQRKAAKAGRNDPCPCGSGRKYKRCCLGKASAVPRNR